MAVNMQLDKIGRIPTYRVQKEYALLNSLSDAKPSKRIVKTKRGLRAIKALIDLEKNHNVSWYRYLKERNQKNLKATALFYRGNKITFEEMFYKAEEVAKSFLQNGLKSGEEIGVCVTNSPELVYILLASNMLGIKVNCFGSKFKKEYLEEIIGDVSSKAIFVSDDVYEDLKPVLGKKKNIIMTSLADSLSENPKACDEYEEELDSYYHFENKVSKYKLENSEIKSFSDFVSEGKKYQGKIMECGDLETDFLITYTSGSTKIGLPKALIHKNRSLIASGRFHDPELCGNPKISGLRGLAHIHPDSNTDVITCISDNLMQGWSVALEPKYSLQTALDCLVLNKPNYLNITTNHMLEVAKQYLLDKKFHNDGKGRKLGFLFAAFTVGEGTQLGQEKFINLFLREARAGSDISIKGLKMPFVPVSVGGGDCEHGGIYYTLWKSLYQKLYAPILRKKEIGMMPVPYAIVTALKQDKNGLWLECDYDEMGVIVANSYTNLSGYKHNREATENLLIKDNLGRTFVTCNVYGYIDKVGGVHVKGRIPTKMNIIPNFYIEDLVTKDTKNILSCKTVDVEDKKVMTIQFQPLAKVNQEKVLFSLYKRLSKTLSVELMELLYIRILPPRESFPLTGSLKCSEVMLEQRGFEETIKLSEIPFLKEDYSLKRKKVI